MKSSASICPVPEEQQPLQEYQSLQESWFFSWATRDLRGFILPIAVLWCLSWGLAGPVASVSFPLTKDPLHWVVSGAIGACVIPVLTLLRLYLGWVYVRDRLHKETVSYEESGWYDGQTWTKPAEWLQRDRWVVTYQVQPILQRLAQTFKLFGVFVLGSGLAWILL